VVLLIKALSNTVLDIAGRYFLLYHYGGVYSDLDIGCNNQSIRRILASIEENQGVSVMEVKPYGFSLDKFIIFPFKWINN
jgi:mannosyltransferase OCH1-like enzyme